MLSSELQSERKRAIQIILQIRGEDEFGNDSPRLNNITYGPRASRKPVVNLDALSVLDLIPRSDYKFEPSFTAVMSKRELKLINFKKLRLPKAEGFTQNVERLIRRTTEASAIYWDHLRRDAHIRAQQHLSLSVKLPELNSKKDYLPLLKSITL